MKKTKIICTIGPSSLSEDKMRQMYEAGMNAARINTAYGDLRQYKQIVTRIRRIADIPVILDLKGPEIRIRTKHKLTVHNGSFVDVGSNDEDVGFNHDFLGQMVVGDIVYIDNGKIKTEVVDKKGETLRLLVANEGVIDDGKGVNIPNKRLNVPAVPDRDLKLIEFAKECGIEYLALSFTRNKHDVEELRKVANGFDGGITAKIENSEGVKNIIEILDNVDSVMVARGDLGVEIQPERVPLVQKSIIKQCNQKGRIVVTATDMLESMIDRPIPTRAEVSDAANAILDGADALMLSGETSIGKYPVESVQMLSRVALEAETSVQSHIEDGEYENISETISKSIQRICQSMSIDKIVTLTRSGYTARMISRFKISPEIIAVTPNKTVKKQLEISYGVHPVCINYRKRGDAILSVAKNLRLMNLLVDDDIVLFTAAFRTAMKHASNLIEIHKISELMGFGSA